MAFIDLNTDKIKLHYITKILARRRMRPLLDEEWEVHGPHEEMNYVVYTGPAIYLGDKMEVYVVIYPRAVYEIDHPSDWWKTDKDRQVFV